MSARSRHGPATSCSRRPATGTGSTTHRTRTCSCSGGGRAPARWRAPATSCPTRPELCGNGGLQRRRDRTRDQLDRLPVDRYQRAEQEVADAEVGVGAQALDALLRRADDHHLLKALRQRVAVQLRGSLPGGALVVVEDSAKRERPADVRRVTADVAAVAREHVELVPVLVDVAVEGVPDVAVLGDGPERPALAGPADDKRQVVLDRLRLEASVLQLEVPALERRRLLRPEAPHDPARLVEHVHPYADARKRDSILVVLELEPGGPHPELQPPAAHASRVRRHGRQQRQALELRPRRVRMDRIEVVEVRYPVVAELLAPEPQLTVVVEARVLRARV